MEIDPIMQEVYEAKEQIAREAGYDIDAICIRLQESQKRRGNELIAPTPEQVEVVREALRQPPAA